jgi:GTP-binding protein LepA
MGYVRFGLRDPRQADPGTILIFRKDVGKDVVSPALAACGLSKSVLYASVHPNEAEAL